MSVLKIKRWWRSLFGWYVRTEVYGSNMSPEQERDFHEAFRKFDEGFEAMQRVFNAYETKARKRPHPKSYDGESVRSPSGSQRSSGDGAECRDRAS